MLYRRSTRFLMAAVLALAFLPALAGELTVSAASSLTQAFRDMAQAYQTRYPEARVALNFGASGALLQQIARGAPVDVFAAADQETMDQAEAQGLVLAGERRDFVRNTLVLITAADSTLALRRLEDLGQATVTRIALGNPDSVPAGRYARRALEAPRLWPVLQAKVITTQNVRQSLDYVARGEVDAGFVYGTDAALMKDKVKVVLEVPLDIAIRYPVAKITASPRGEEARRFMAYLASPAALAILAHHGFGKLGP